ncbi:hypothetical protein HPB50_013618 [Hyalomma asiaticum]|uniref:Uncharacterized protein n=1 Tax=Hyalomma asiaticum TaxID=266040 RepID=A0ACB7RJX3_HYAAI|nr:hypothetical protein HPB50_013618 [Hyalomma asiaticum]
MAPIELENKAEEEQRLQNGGDHDKRLPCDSPEKILPAGTLKPPEKPVGPKENGSFDDVGSASDLLSETQTPCMSPRRLRRERLWSGSAKDDSLLLTRQRTIYTAGRPPWYNVQGQLVEPFVIGICGGSASGKTTVAKKIIEALNVPWVTLLSMDSFYKMMDMKIFIDTDSDIRLARRLQRDITDRGRDLEGCLAQYERFVKPAFDHYIAPSMVHADLIVPRDCGFQRGLKLRSKMAESHTGQPLPASLHLLPQTPQLRGIHTFIRNRATQRDEFIFYSKRLMRLLMEYTVAQLPFKDVSVETPQVMSCAHSM